MDKFEQRKADLLKKLEDDLGKLEEAQKAHARKIIKPTAGKFAAIISEEVEKIGADDITKIESYSFNKTELRSRIREFIKSEFSVQKTS